MVKKYKTKQEQKWSQSLTRGSNCKALTGKVLVFWIGAWSLMGGGRLRFVVAHGGSTVLHL